MELAKNYAMMAIDEAESINDHVWLMYANFFLAKIESKLGFINKLKPK